MTSLLFYIVEIGGAMLAIALLIAVSIEARTIAKQWGADRRRFRGRRPYDWRIDE